MLTRYFLRLCSATLCGVFLGAVAAAVIADEHAAADHHQALDAHSGAVQNATGPHGGRLLQQGDTRLELALIEAGAAPVYRAWITQGGAPVRDATLTVDLTRLGGAVNRLAFVDQGEYWVSQGSVAEPHSFDVAVTLQIGDQAHSWQWSSYEGRVVINARQAAQSGIRTKAVGAGVIARHVQTYGRLVTPVDKTVRVRARFQGVIDAVNVNLGDAVKQGEVLAYVESNDSLRSYPVRAPIDGIVQQRMANTGEVTGDQPLFVLVNHEQLWAEFQIFPNQRSAVKVNQTVHINHNGHIHTSAIASITPSLPGEPYVLARAVVPNTQADMAPGDLVSGRIEIERIAAPIVVENAALQSFRDWQVVFVNVGTQYEARPLVLGATDGQLTEVRAGLRAHDQYVFENSYLVKADILKTGASHDH